MNVAGTSEGLPTDDDRPERRRRWLLVVVSIGLTLVIAGTLVLSAKSNPRLHPVAVPTTTSTTAATGDYATEVSAADATLAGLLALGVGWDATAAVLQKDAATVSPGAGSAQAALQSARAAHRQKPQNCTVVVASTDRVQSATAQVVSTATSVSARAGQVLDALAQSQPQVDQLSAQVAAAGAKATPAQSTALQSLQVAAAALGAHRTAMTQTMTSLRDKADTAAANGRTLSGQATTLAATCSH